MAKGDEKGWGAAPPVSPGSEYWHCPQCRHNTAPADWPDGGDGTRSCPKCRFVYTEGTSAAPGTSARISGSHFAGHVHRDSTAAEDRCCKLAPRAA